MVVHWHVTSKVSQVGRPRLVQQSKHVLSNAQARGQPWGLYAKQVHQALDAMLLGAANHEVSVGLPWTVHLGSDACSTHQCSGVSTIHGLFHHRIMSVSHRINQAAPITRTHLRRHAVAVHDTHAMAAHNISRNYSSTCMHMLEPTRRQTTLPCFFGYGTG